MPLNRNKKTVCVIPAYNEAENISRTVAGVMPYFDQVLVVDDGSSDDSGLKARQSGAVVLRHMANRGQGAALETGNEWARRSGADIVVHFDADGQFSPEDIPAMLAPLREERANIVFGSRFLGKESNMPAFKKNMLFPLAKSVNRIFFGISLSDPQIGLRAMDKTALDKIGIELDGFAHCTEIMYKSFRAGLRIEEVPVKVFYQRAGLGFWDGIIIFKDLLIAKLLF